MTTLSARSRIRYAAAPKTTKAASVGRMIRGMPRLTSVATSQRDARLEAKTISFVDRLMPDGRCQPCAQLPQPPDPQDPQDPVPQPVGLLQPPSSPHPPPRTPFAFGSSYRRQHFSRPQSPDNRDGF